MGNGELEKWPTVQGWVWLQEYGDANGESVPFVRLSYTRGVPAVELELPRTASLLVLWWEAIEDPPDAKRGPGWVPAWVWSEQDGHDSLAWVCLDPTDDVTPRELLMPTSARSRLAVRRALSQALMRLTGEQSVEAALESAQVDPSSGVAADGPETVTEHDADTQDEPAEPWALEHTTELDVPSEFNDADRPQDGEDDWPTLPVWLWLEEDEGGTWRANARLSPTDGVPALPVQAPVAPIGLTRLWLRVGARRRAHDDRPGVALGRRR
ncbi:hypothetical protein [Kribbella swartbergensis]